MILRHSPEGYDVIFGGYGVAEDGLPDKIGLTSSFRGSNDDVRERVGSRGGSRINVFDMVSYDWIQ